MKRQQFAERKILLVGEDQVKLACNLIKNVPIDRERPIEVVVRERQKVRKLDQNALMWSGPLKDIAEQAWVGDRPGPLRQFSDVVWHEHFKRCYLPEEYDPDLCKEGYVKWAYTPSGDRVLIGSTTQLTVKGFAQYLEQVYAFGADLGVMFTESPRQRQ